MLAPNPSPMTLDGTNTWLIAEPGSATAIIIDPGPLDEGHLLRVRDEVAGPDAGWRSSCSPTGTATTRPGRPGWPR